MLQATLPCILFASGPTELVLRGGTDAEMAPPIDYFQKVRSTILMAVHKYELFYSVGISAYCRTVWC